MRFRFSLFRLFEVTTFVALTLGICRVVPEDARWIAIVISGGIGGAYLCLRWRESSEFLHCIVLASTMSALMTLFSSICVAVLFLEPQWLLLIIELVPLAALLGFCLIATVLHLQS